MTPIIAYGLLGLAGVGVYLLGCCFYELSQIRRTLVQRNQLAQASLNMKKKGT
jgi:hypothetical protein